MVTLVKGLAAVCCLLSGKRILMALGLTTVEVIMKNSNSRNMMSVMEAMLKLASTLVRCLRAISEFCRFVKKVHEFHGLGLQIGNQVADSGNEVVVGKVGKDAYDEAGHGGDHGHVD